VKYAILIETTDDGTYGAYAPDLPGVGVTADSPHQARTRLREAITLHLEGLTEDGLPIPRPTVEIGYVETSAA
jgi:predicted RNase H-like HicB family nuclease